MRGMKRVYTGSAVAVGAVALVAAGYGAGWFFAPGKVVAAPTVETVRTIRVEGDGEQALALSKALSEAEALRAERDALRAQLAEAQAQPEAAETAEEAPRRLSARERMEELKRTDPKRYEEMQARRQEFRTRMAEALATRDDFLGSIDLSLLTEEQRETHRRFTEALAAQQEAMARMDAAMESGVEPTEEERQQMREAFRNVRDLQNAERDALLGAVATSMGLQAGEEADSFVEVVKSVYDSTGMMPAVRMGPGGGGNPPPPPGP